MKFTTKQLKQIIREQIELENKQEEEQEIKELLSQGFEMSPFKRSKKPHGFYLTSFEKVTPIKNMNYHSGLKEYVELRNSIENEEKLWIYEITLSSNEDIDYDISFEGKDSSLKKARVKAKQDFKEYIMDMRKRGVRL